MCCVYKTTVPGERWGELERENGTQRGKIGWYKAAGRREYRRRNTRQWFLPEISIPKRKDKWQTVTDDNVVFPKFETNWEKKTRIKMAVGSFLFRDIASTHLERVSKKYSSEIHYLRYSAGYFLSVFSVSESKPHRGGWLCIHLLWDDSYIPLQTLLTNLNTWQSNTL